MPVIRSIRILFSATEFLHHSWIPGIFRGLQWSKKFWFPILRHSSGPLSEVKLLLWKPANVVWSVWWCNHLHQLRNQPPGNNLLPWMLRRRSKENSTVNPDGLSDKLQFRPFAASSHPWESGQEKLFVPFRLLQDRHWQQILYIPRAQDCTVKIPEYPSHRPLKVWFVPYLPALCSLLLFEQKYPCKFP